MNVNINFFFTRVTVLILTTEQPTVPTTVLPTEPSTATNFTVVYEWTRPALYYNVTVKGNSKGAPCVFPFFYNGSYYNDCVSFDHSKPWCSTTDNYTRDGQWGECLDYDVCLNHKTLSDPWRNIGCVLNSFHICPDFYLQEGWYRFTGIGGDLMAYSCLIITDTVCDTSNDFWFQDRAWGLDCGEGLILYYLVPISGVYLTYHSSCSASSCGLNGYCDSSDGSCMYGYDEYNLNTEDSCTCKDILPIFWCNIFAQDYTNDNTYDDALNTMDNTTNSSVNTVITHNNPDADPGGILLCVNRNIQWGKKHCNSIQFDHNHTICLSECPIIDEALYLYTVVVMPVGLVFLGFTLLTFALCRRQPNVNNMALVNLCISLLLTHILLLVKETFRKQALIRLTHLACAVLAGILHFLFLSAFVWMFIDAVLLLISAKNLTKIRSHPKEVIGWKCVAVIGYVIPLIVVGVSAVAVPNGYNSKRNRCPQRRLGASYHTVLTDVPHVSFEQKP